MRNILPTILTCLLFTFCIHSQKLNHREHWTYSGKDGPAYWGTMSLGYKACSDGEQQSPIDLHQTVIEGREVIHLHREQSVLEEIDNGHTIKVLPNVKSSFHTDGEEYYLQQMHFHAPSEHTVDQKTFPMEIHFVHKSPAGRLAVMGVFVQESLIPNNTLGKLLLTIPNHKGESTHPPDSTSLYSLIPEEQSHWHYKGSLTTPPCSEGLDWIVFATTIKASRRQIELFEKHYSHNNRPVQKEHNRIVHFFK
jgi:carbonic anhydrase